MFSELQEKAAKLAGKEAAIFVPSGTMGNLIASKYLCGQLKTFFILYRGRGLIPEVMLPELFQG